MAYKKSKNKNKRIQIIPLGGVGEIGKNMFVIKYEDEILVLDAGLSFPEDEMLGVDAVIPNISYLLENKKNLKGIILSHGHEDHIGALPYIINDLNVPIWGTKLTLGMVKAKLSEFNQVRKPELKEITPRDKVTLSDNIQLEFFRTNHSIPDCVGVIIKTPAGIVVYTSDYKFDQTPVNSLVTDYDKLAKLGKSNVMVMLSDSTNAVTPGYAGSEKEVGKALDDIFRMAEGRIIVATFASNIHRVQQVVNSAVKYNRKIAITGRSLFNTTKIARELGYLDIPDDFLVDLDQLENLLPHEITVITTGSQGEPMSALTRLAKSEHRNLKIANGDTVIVSASPIPGNEKMVFRTIDNLFKLGAEVYYHQMSGVHVSGHGAEEEIKMMLNMVQPRYLIPVHGEYRHMVHLAKISEKVGIPKENVFFAENGSVIEFSSKGGKKLKKVTAGKVLLDGLGVGDVGNIVLKDRKVLSEDGIVIVVIVLDDKKVVGSPEIITRGFVYVRESEELLDEAKNIIIKYFKKIKQDKKKEKDENVIKNGIRDKMSRLFWEKTGRNPMILPIIMKANN